MLVSLLLFCKSWSAVSFEEVSQELRSLIASRHSLYADITSDVQDALQKIPTLQPDQEGVSLFEKIVLVMGDNKLGVLLKRYQGLPQGLSEERWKFLKLQLLKNIEEFVTDRKIIAEKEFLYSSILEIGNRGHLEALGMVLTLELESIAHECIHSIKGFLSKKSFLSKEEMSSLEQREQEHLIQHYEEKCYALRCVCKALSTEKIRESFMSYSSTTDYGSYFQMLEAYVLGLVENPPQLSHRVFAYVKGDFGLLTNHLAQMGIRNNLKDLRRLEKQKDSNKDSIAAQIKKEEEVREDIIQQLDGHPFKKIKHLQEAQTQALQQLALFQKELIRRDYCTLVKVQQEKAKKLVAIRRRERREATAKTVISGITQESEESFISKGQEPKNLFVSECLNLAPVLMKEEPVNPISLAPAVIEDDTDDANSENQREIAEAMAEFYAYNKKVPQAAAAFVQVPEVPRQIFLPARDWEIVTKFWKSMTLPWTDFIRFFTRVLGAAMEPNGGSIRNFEFANGKKIVVHEGHPDPTLGPNTLRRVRDWLGEHLRLTQESFSLRE